MVQRENSKVTVSLLNPKVNQGLRLLNTVERLSKTSLKSIHFRIRLFFVYKIELLFNLRVIINAFPQNLRVKMVMLIVRTPTNWFEDLD